MAAQPPEPADVPALGERARALHRAGRLAEARPLYEAVLAAAPNDLATLVLLGHLLMQSGAPQEAAEVLARAARAHPGVAAAHGLLGEALFAAGRAEDGLASLDRALALAPDPQAWARRAAVLGALGRPDEAVRSWDEAIALSPGEPSLHTARGLALMSLRRFEAALAAFDAALDLAPDQDDARHGRVAALLALRRPEAALAACDEAIALRPEDAGFHNSRGQALNALRRQDAALAAFERAVALRPDFAEALNNRALALAKLGRREEALAAFDAAIAVRPDNVAARYGRAFQLLGAGDFANGWREYEWRLGLTPPPGPPLDEPRRWRGEPLAGRRLFVHCEQGLGDTIQFARYPAELGRTGARVSFAVQAPLAPLLRGLAPGVEIVVQGEPPPPFDVHCPLLSLPLAFGTTPGAIPWAGPYLRADADRKARFAARLGAKRRRRVGLAWSGNPAQENDYNRSMPFAALEPLLGAEVEFVCLQNLVRPADAAAFARSGRVSFHGEALGDFAETAALADLMDLVITVDTSLAHLAGAIGKPVWILLAAICDWRWGWRGETSPWYPGARLFRQPRIGDWESVVAEVAAALGP